MKVFGQRRIGDDQGLTLIELIVSVSIVAILAAGILPVARFQVKREKERELRRDLQLMRTAIDKYKEACDRGGFLVKKNTYGYPDDLEQLTGSVDVAGEKVKFLREIPTDPMTGNKDWGMRSMQDDPQSTGWGGENVWNVYSKSTGTALNGTKYSDW
jgi:general secretion pathway protein G